MLMIKRLFFLMLLPAFLGGVASAQTKAPAAPAPKATAAEATALANRAIAHIKDVGPEKAFADFSAQDGKWVDRELYVLVIGFDGIMKAHGTVKPLIGKPQLEMRDVNGKFMSKEMLEVAQTKGTGWVDYLWSNPVTKKIDPKSTYVVRIPGYDGFVGVGIYK